MLTKEQNERLTRVGAGTPMGELFRRYWHPIAAVAQMKDRDTLPIRLFGEDLVLYRDRHRHLRPARRPLPAPLRCRSSTAFPRNAACAAPITAGPSTTKAACVDQPYDETGSGSALQGQGHDHGLSGSPSSAA